MNSDTDLFVQAFWVKCREVIRPEIDVRIADLRRAGHGADVSTQEFTQSKDDLAAPAGPSVRLSIRPVNETVDAGRRAIEFHGDVHRQEIEVVADGARSQTYELAALGTDEVKTEIDRWLAGRPSAAPV